MPRIVFSLILVNGNTRQIAEVVELAKLENKPIFRGQKEMYPVNSDPAQIFSPLGKIACPSPVVAGVTSLSYH